MRRKDARPGAIGAALELLAGDPGAVERSRRDEALHEDRDELGAGEEGGRHAELVLRERGAHAELALLAPEREPEDRAPDPPDERGALVRAQLVERARSGPFESDPPESLVDRGLAGRHESQVLVDLEPEGAPARDEAVLGGDGTPERGARGREGAHERVEGRGERVAHFGGSWCPEPSWGGVFPEPSGGGVFPPGGGGSGSSSEGGFSVFQLFSSLMKGSPNG